MNARELRIGNWILDTDNGDEYQVVEITKDGFVAGPMEVYPAGMEGNYGIPLTAEWLTRFGFDYHYDAYRRNINKGSPLRMWLTVRVFADSVGVYILHKHGLSIAHVHQLQNLYFALTGEELELETVKEKI